MGVGLQATGARSLQQAGHRPVRSADDLGGLMDSVNGGYSFNSSGEFNRESATSARVRVRTLIIDDAPSVRQGVRLLLSQDTEVEVVGEASSGAEALALVRRERPDLVLL